mmetsp:Transcript_30073/g.72487  ORF Transcript_30073/g.72487 Transcript_30073/m.72487 type:complete len:1186 (-) Transcript_30073:255-3812(-)
MSRKRDNPADEGEEEDLHLALRKQVAHLYEDMHDEEDVEADDEERGMKSSLILVFRKRCKNESRTRNEAESESRARVSRIYADFFGAAWEESTCRFTDEPIPWSSFQDKGKMLICPSHPDDPFSRLEIDTTLSGFGPGDVQVLQALYKALAYGPKLSYFTGDAKFAMRNLDFKMPGIENIIFGDCQSGKSAEAAFAAWCSIFLLGCLPVILVRNKGGKTQGSADMVKALKRMNERVQEVLGESFPSVDPKRFLMTILETDDAVREHLKAQRRVTAVLVMLNNPPKIKKLMENGHLRSNSPYFPAKIVSDRHRDGQWTVRYMRNGQEESVCEKDMLVLVKNKKQRPGAGALRKGSAVHACMSDRLRTQPSVFDELFRCCGLKDGRLRALFVVDEGDQAVGAPERNKTAGDRLHYLEAANLGHEARNEMGDQKGARGYVFGSIIVTATPGACLLCEYAVQTCGLCMKHLEAGEAGTKVRCERGHVYHPKCMQDFFNEDPERREAFRCPSCKTAAVRSRDAHKHAQESDEDSAGDPEGGVDDGGADTETDDEGSGDSRDMNVDSTADDEDIENELGLLCEKDDCKDVIVSDNVHSLTTKITRTDRPDNYVSYPEFMLPGDKCVVVERMRLEKERERKSMTVYEAYQSIWLGKHDHTVEAQGTTADWDQMVTRAMRGGLQKLFSDNFTLQRYQNSVRVVANTRAINKPEACLVDKKIYALAREIKDRCTLSGVTPFEVDRDGITKMISSMLEPNGGSFRHALISSQNTANLNQQNIMRDNILYVWRNDVLAVMTYSHKGIVVKFTDKSLELRPDLVERAVERARGIYVQETIEKDKEKVAKGTPGRRDTSKSAEDLIVETVDDSSGNFNGFRCRVAEIGIAYETLKQLGCTRSVTIAGAIGGRGVSYHDLENETVLTDMYSAIDVMVGKTPTAHGEQQIQMLGRLNTIIKPGVVAPRFRLWAPKSLHDLHIAYINQVLSFTTSVQKMGNLREALEAEPRHLACGGVVVFNQLQESKQPLLRFSRNNFSGKRRLGDRGPKGAKRKVELSLPREIQLPIRPYEVIESPAGAFAQLDVVWPQAFGSQEEWDSVTREEYLWEEGEDDGFDENQHVVFRVSVPGGESDGERLQEGFRAAGDLGFKFLSMPGGNGGMQRAEFKTREAAFDFLKSGVLGEGETQLWRELINSTRFD